MSAPGVSTGVRASDEERERVAQILQAAAAEGRLEPEEAGERLAAASAATYREDLHRLIADLPASLGRDAGPAPGRWRGGAWWVWRAARVALVVMLVTAWWGFWSVRFVLWPLGLFAVAFLLRPWSRRRYAAGRGRGPRWGGF